MHNVHHLLSLITAVRTAILEDRYPDFVKQFFARYFGNNGPPVWASDALRTVGIELLDNY